MIILVSSFVPLFSFAFSSHVSLLQIGLVIDDSPISSIAERAGGSINVSVMVLSSLVIYCFGKQKQVEIVVGSGLSSVCTGVGM